MKCGRSWKLAPRCVNGNRVYKSYHAFWDEDMVQNLANFCCFIAFFWISREKVNCVASISRCFVWSTTWLKCTYGPRLNFVLFPFRLSPLPHSPVTRAEEQGEVTTSFSSTNRDKTALHLKGIITVWYTDMLFFRFPQWEYIPVHLPTARHRVGYQF